MHMFGEFGPMLPYWAGTIFPILAIWSIFWKGLALWHSSRRNEGWWFLALLVINTLGLLEILYLFVFAKIPTQKLFPMKMGTNESSKPEASHEQN